MRCKPPSSFTRSTTSTTVRKYLRLRYGNAKAYFNGGDIKEGNLTEAAKAAGFKYGRTVIYDDKDNPKYLNIKFKKNGDIKSVEVKEEYYKQNFRSASGLLRTECADANQKTLRYTYFIAAIVLVVLAMPMFFYGFKTPKKDSVLRKTTIPRRSDTTSGCCSKQTFVAPCSFGYPWRRENGLYIYGRFVLL